MDWLDDFDFGGMVESVSEGASDWVSGYVKKEVAEISAQPETNDAKAKNVTFGDGKESPTVSIAQPATASLINGVDNKTLGLGVVSIIAVILVVRG
ncbi:MAG: hypothetical protein MJK12_12425 [Colwellia sp.]|nr:hypothetical protein [Colwellia sp.]